MSSPWVVAARPTPTTQLDNAGRRVAQTARQHVQGIAGHAVAVGLLPLVLHRADRIVDVDLSIQFAVLQQAMVAVLEPLQFRSMQCNQAAELSQPMLLR